MARCIDLVDQSGLDIGCTPWVRSSRAKLAALLDLLRRCIEAVATDCDRVSVSAKLDYRKGHPGALAAKVASVEKRLGHAVKK